MLSDRKICTVLEYISILSIIVLLINRQQYVVPSMIMACFVLTLFVILLHFQGGKLISEYRNIPIKNGNVVNRPYTYLNSPHTGEAISIVIQIVTQGKNGIIPNFLFLIIKLTSKINIVQTHNPILHCIQNSGKSRASPLDNISLTLSLVFVFIVIPRLFSQVISDTLQ